MKKTLSVSEVAEMLKNDQYASWSYLGARALACYLDEMDDECGTDTEIDIVAIRCDFAEYATALEAVSDYAYEEDPDLETDEEKEEAALTWLKDRTTVIEFTGGVIIMRF